MKSPSQAGVAWKTSLVTALESSPHREPSGSRNTLSTSECNTTKHVRPVVRREGWQAKRKGIEEEEGCQKQVDSDLGHERGTKSFGKRMTSSEGFQTSEVESERERRGLPRSPGDVPVAGRRRGPLRRVQRPPPPADRAPRGSGGHTAPGSQTAAPRPGRTTPRLLRP